MLFCDTTTGGHCSLHSHGERLQSPRLGLPECEVALPGTFTSTSWDLFEHIYVVIVVVSVKGFSFICVYSIDRDQGLF